jgi:hypothetical protein
LPLANFAIIRDNTDGDRVLIAEKVNDGPLVIHDEQRWRAFSEVQK